MEYGLLKAPGGVHMRSVRIGILDNEREYVENLSAYLGRFGKGKWVVSAFTDQKVLKSYLEGKRLDILAGTDQKELRRLQEEYAGFSVLWLSDQEDAKTNDIKIQSVYRFQSTQIIGTTIEHMVNQTCFSEQAVKLMVAIYSPVGRCGKTTMALKAVQNDIYGKWLYIGMEDYSSFQFGEEGINNIKNEIDPDDFIFYLKEHQTEKLLALAEKSMGVIASGWSVFDRKQIDEGDMVWLKNTLKQSGYYGTVFDFGTGVLQNYEIFSLFDYIMVPYLTEEKSMIKRKNFERLLDLYGLEDAKEKIIFINMESQKEVIEKMDEIFKGRSR